MIFQWCHLILPLSNDVHHFPTDFPMDFALRGSIFPGHHPPCTSPTRGWTRLPVLPEVPKIQEEPPWPQNIKEMLIYYTIDINTYIYNYINIWCYDSCLFIFYIMIYLDIIHLRFYEFIWNRCARNWSWGLAERTRMHRNVCIILQL